jgi:hypothetical protein
MISYQVFASDRARVVGGSNLAQSHLDLVASLPLLPASFTTASARPNLLYNGADYQIQRLTLHLAASVQLRVSPARLSRRVSALTLSIASRVPSCCIAAVYALRRTYRMVDCSFPGGLPSPLNGDHFQVSCQ